MKQLVFPVLSATLMLSACAGNSLAPQSGNEFHVSSEPSGAAVYVMGKQVGTTPLRISSSQVFPVTFSEELQNKYGKVELKHPACRPYEKTVSGYIIANGLSARLECDQVATQQRPASEKLDADVTRGDLQERLRKLKAIYEEGLITQEEYNSKRQDILQDL